MVVRIKSDDGMLSAWHTALHMVRTQQMLTVIPIMVILIVSLLS